MVDEANVLNQIAQVKIEKQELHGKLEQPNLEA